jgi:hypothetical protein
MLVFIEEERSEIVPVNGTAMVLARVSCIQLSVSHGAVVELLSAEQKLRAMNAALKKTLLAVFYMSYLDAYAALSTLGVRLWLTNWLRHLSNLWRR